MKQVMILGGLLGLALVGSYLTWTAEESEQAADTVVVFNATPSTLSKLVWEDEANTVEITRESDAAGDWLRISHTQRKKVTPPAAEAPAEGAEPPAEGAEPPAEGAEPPAEGAEPPAEGAEPPADAAPQPEPVIEVETSVFAGGAAAQTLWDAFGPLLALRELTLGPDAALDAFGLHEPNAKLTVAAGATTATLDVGGESFGTRDRYLRLDGRVFLVDDKTLRPMQAASTRLVERRLHPLGEDELRTVSVRRGSETRSFTYVAAASKEDSFWADQATPSKRDAQAATWIEKLGRLQVKGYLTALPEGLTPAFTFEAQGEAGTRWEVQILTGTEDGKPAYYAQSTFNRLPLQLTPSMARGPIEDLDAVMSGEAPAEEAPTEPAPTEPATEAPPAE
jgi:hypothetical protein